MDYSLIKRLCRYLLTYYFYLFHIIFDSFQLQETQETTNQVRKSAENLSNKMKQARDEREEDLKETRDVVKELKDFLSGIYCLSTEGAWIIAQLFAMEIYKVSAVTDCSSPGCVFTDPLSNLTDIQNVSDWILKAKLPLSLPALKKKLDELKDLTANLPNSTAVLNEAEPQLDTARKLLKEAQDARWTFLPFFFTLFCHW